MDLNHGAYIGRCKVCGRINAACVDTSHEGKRGAKRTAEWLQEMLSAGLAIEHSDVATVQLEGVCSCEHQPDKEPVQPQLL